MSVHNPRIIKKDNVSYQFVWDVTPVNLKTVYYLYIYDCDNVNSTPVCQNLNNPIPIQYNQIIDLKEIESYCSESNFYTPKAKCKFKIIEEGEQLIDTNFFPNDFYYLGMMLTDIQCESNIENNSFILKLPIDCINYFQDTDRPILSYNIWVKPVNDNTINYFPLIDYKFDDVNSQLIFNHNYLNNLQFNTAYSCQVTYDREEGSYNQPMLKTEYVDTIVLEEEYICEATPYNSITTKKPSTFCIKNVGAIDMVYIPASKQEKLGKDQWYFNFGDKTVKGEGTEGVVRVSNPQLRISDKNMCVCNISKYIFMECYVKTTKNTTQPLTKKITLYKKPETQTFNLNSVFNFNTGDNYKYDDNVFITPINTYKCIDYVNPGPTAYYLCKYEKKDILTSDLYIYQKQYNNTYKLTNDLINLDFLSKTRYFKLYDPDESHLGNPPLYDVVCTDAPVLNDKKELKINGISEAEIQQNIKNSSYSYDISLFKIANINPLNPAEPEFKENFDQNSYYSIISNDKKHSLDFRFKGVRKNEEEMKQMNNSYQLWIQSKIDNTVIKKLDLKEHEVNGQKYWFIYEDGVLYDTPYNNFALDDIIDMELASKKQYTVFLKAFSSNMKRSKTIRQNNLSVVQDTNFAKYNDFLQAPSVEYLPNGNKVYINETFNVKYNETISIPLIDCQTIYLWLNKTTTDTNNSSLWQYQYSQLDKNNNEVNTLFAKQYELLYGSENKKALNVNYNYSTIHLTNLDNSSESKELKIMKVFPHYRNYNNAITTNFGYCIEKDDIYNFNLGRPWMLFNNQDDITKIAYFGYSQNAKNAEQQDPGLHNYDYNLSHSKSKISIFPTTQIEPDSTKKILLTFRITELVQNNIITSNTFPKFTSTNLTQVKNEYVNNKKNIEYATNSEEIGILKIAFSSNSTLINSIQNLYATCDKLEIKGNPMINGDLTTYYTVNNLSNDRINFDNKKIEGKELYLYITNGSIVANDLKIIQLKKAISLTDPTSNKGIRNRIFKTDNIKLYLNTSKSINYANTENGIKIKGEVIDAEKPVNFYIENFSDLQNDEYGDLIYKIEKITEEYRAPLIFPDDSNYITITQKSKLKESFDTEFYINSDTNKLQIQNTKITKVSFAKQQENTIVNCLLEKEIL